MNSEDFADSEGSISEIDNDENDEDFIPPTL